MRAPLRCRRMVRLVAIVAVAVAAACASATNGNNPGQDAANDRFDASPKIYEDAPASHLDGGPVDAFVPRDAPADATPGSGGQICSVNGDCPDSGTCCFVAICVP